jgi:glutamyl-tRNA reductase
MLVLIGLNHKTAPVEVRERMSVQEDALEDELGLLRALPGVEGVVVVSTCNRVEIACSVQGDEAAGLIVARQAERARMERSELERHLYILREGDVVRHLFRVASGLDSMIVGEPQIAGQVRQGYHAARTGKTLDPILHKLFEHTLRVAKKIRTETGIGEHAVSIPYAAVELAKKIFGDLQGLRVLLVGAGKIGELTAQHLKGHGLKEILVANRSPERAHELASRFCGDVVPFDSLRAELSRCDIVIASTASPTFVIGRDEVEESMDARRHRDLFLVDLSVPRNIDPEIAQVSGAYLYNIDDLKEIADSNREIRLGKAAVAGTIIDREVETFLGRLATQEAIPTILELRERLEELRAAELEKCLRKMGPLSPEQRAAVEALSNGIINKVLHYPILRLKESAAENRPESGEVIRETIRKIFGLR